MTKLAVMNLVVVLLMGLLNAEEKIVVTAVAPPPERISETDGLYVCICVLADVEGESAHKKQKIQISKSDILVRSFDKWPIEKGAVYRFTYYGPNEFYGSPVTVRIDDFRIIQVPGLVNLKRFKEVVGNENTMPQIANTYNEINKKYPGVFSSFITVSPESNEPLWFSLYPPKIDVPLDVTRLVIKTVQDKKSKD